MPLWIMPSCPIHASYPLLPLWNICYLGLFGLFLYRGVSGLLFIAASPGYFLLRPLWVTFYLGLFGLLWSALLTSRHLVSRMLLLSLVEEISPQLLKQASWCLLLPATGSGSLGQDGKDFQRFEKQEEKIPWGRRLGLGVVEGWPGGGGGGGGRRASSPSPCSTACACRAPPASPSSPHSALPLGGSVEQWGSKMCVCVGLQQQ